MVYDWSDHYVVFFGGLIGGLPAHATWIFNGTWTDLASQLSTAPPGRYVGMMTYDWADQYVLLFGGYNSSTGTLLSDTWTFHSGAWKQLTPSTHPAARWRSGMTYDVVDGYVLLFGGTSNTGTYGSADTWKYVGGTWTNITKTITGTPPPRFRTSMVYDANDSYVILFGGTDVGGNPSDATWKYVNLTWTNITSTVGTAPSPREYTEMGYDNATGKVVLFGGSLNNGNLVTSDTWTFSGGKWTNVTSGFSTNPPAIGFAALTYDSQTGFLMLFGGESSSGGFTNQSWALGPPVIEFGSVNPPAIDANQSVLIAIHAYSNHPPIHYAFTGLPTGCSSSNTANLTCSPTGLGTFSVTAYANDSSSDSSNTTVQFQVTPPPSITSFTANHPTITVGFPTNLTVRETGGALPLSYGWSGQPASCPTVDLPYLLCTSTASGPFTVQVTVTDSRGANASSTLLLTVAPTPTVSGFFANPPLIDVGQATNFQVTLFNGVPPFHYNYSGLPNGCVTSSVANLSCSPTATGSFMVTVNATDSSGASATAVAALGVNATPTVSSFSVLPPLIDVGQSVTFTASASGGTGYLSYSYGNLPPGCAIGNTSVGSCVPNQAGTYMVTFIATDTVNGNGTRSATLVVHADPAVASSTVSRATLDLGQNITIRVHVTAGTAPFRFAYSNIPASCGAPSTANVSCVVRNQGTFGGTVTVTDAFGKTATGPVPQFSAYADPAIQSITLNPDPAVVGSSATLTVAAIQGSTIYAYNYSGLPPGCASTNASQIVCTPSATGSFVVTVTVKDSEGFTTTGTHGFNVTSGNSGNGLLGLPGNDGLFVIIAIAAAAVVVAAVFLMRRRRATPASEPMAEEQPPMDTVP